MRRASRESENHESQMCWAQQNHRRRQTHTSSLSLKRNFRTSNLLLFIWFIGVLVIVNRFFFLWANWLAFDVCTHTHTHFTPMTCKCTHANYFLMRFPFHSRPTVKSFHCVQIVFKCVFATFSFQFFRRVCFINSKMRWICAFRWQSRKFNTEIKMNSFASKKSSEIMLKLTSNWKQFTFHLPAKVNDFFYVFLVRCRTSNGKYEENLIILMKANVRTVNWIYCQNN